jgi:hypothetical protein
MKLPKRTEQSLEGLRDMINYLGARLELKNLRIVEIGSWVGSSACLFAKYFKKVLCIDPYIKIDGTITNDYDMNMVYNEFINNVGKHSNITHIMHPSTSILPSFEDNEIDIIYIDGSHKYEDVKKDIKLAQKKVKYYITGHDYWQERFPGVVKAVNELLGEPDKVFTDKSWLKKVG